jgi:hypothetical protein
VAIDTDCTCSCKSNYHTITTMTAPNFIGKKTGFGSKFCTFII